MGVVVALVRAGVRRLRCDLSRAHDVDSSAVTADVPGG
ncbi:hypothetical protein FF36_05358 [Frankia torreyi]|uniref:Uncharacterized protein n=1 Tax=Frankia torreyi TaxID=1856 RepID=A0A0D8B7X7_9ACTN|nr:hypothetical protein FF36_05358 [Frankia torreyi]